ncbi:MAG: tetratricopeptide repeat protein [Candidatus Omnitrophica bacterium]|nr:tetratricopeptide repeat protein [Candidatus Omnitrophota bacterium]
MHTAKRAIGNSGVHPFFNTSFRWYYQLRCLILILLGLAIYAQTFGFGFVFDDFNFIVNNPYIKRFDHIHYIWKTFPKTRTVGFYSFALNYQINRLHPQGYHIVNFAIHLVAVGLVWAFAHMLLKIARQAPLLETTHKSSRSAERVYQDLPFIIAVLFLVHPCQTQAISYISQRFESMATVLYISSVYFYLCGRIAPSKAKKIILFICSIGFAIIGIFTKEVAVTIPLMILAVEWIFFSKNSLNSKRFPSWKTSLIIIILGLALFFLFMKIVRNDFINIYFYFSTPSASHDGDIITGSKYVLTQMRVFLTFLRLLIFPFNQNVDYDYPLSQGFLNPPLTLLGFCSIGFIVFLIFRLRSKWPLIAFGLAWILITFLINTAPRAHVIFEHKLYLISFGFFLATVCALAAIINYPRALFGLLITLIAALSLVSYKRNQVWENQLTLWDDVAQKSPYKARAFNGLGTAWDQQGNFIQALFNYNKAIELNPYYAHAYNGRGNVYTKQGNFTQALSDYTKAVEIDPNYADAYYNLGIFYENQGALDQALINYNKAIKINPDYPEAYYNRGNIFRNQTNFIQALSDYSKAIDENPDYEKAYMNRGNTYSRLNHFTQAISDYNKALAINPHDAEVYINRGTCYAQQGDFFQALSDYSRSIRINPESIQGYYNRAASYFELKDFDRAWEDIYKVKSLGGKINPKFLEDLKKYHRAY